MAAPSPSPPRKLLVMVLELHLRGFARLRIEPAISPSGMHWRLAVAPAELFDPSHGARLRGDTWDDSRVAHYSTGQGSRFFDWPDVRDQTTPSGLARRFAARFPETCEAGRGTDWGYTGWYVEMLHLTYPALVPYALADWDTPDDHIPVVGDGDREVRIPLPPPVTPPNVAASASSRSR